MAGPAYRDICADPGPGRARGHVRRDRWTPG